MYFGFISYKSILTSLEVLLLNERNKSFIS